MIPATSAIVASKIFQTVDFTCLAMQRFHSTCDTISQSAQKGTFTRLWDAYPGFVVALGVVLALCLALGACLVALALSDRHMARIRNRKIPNIQTRENETKTFNMRVVSGC